MSLQPMDKLDTAALVVVSGPAGDAALLTGSGS
jgi:hypothetical protein